MSSQSEDGQFEKRATDRFVQRELQPFGGGRCRVTQVLEVQYDPYQQSRYGESMQHLWSSSFKRSRWMQALCIEMHAIEISVRGCAFKSF